MDEDMRRDTISDGGVPPIGRRTLLVLPLAACLVQATHAAAPRPGMARILVGFAAGSGPDLVARHLAHALTGQLADAVIVENRSGAGGNIAVSAALASPSDGHTLLLNPSGVLTINPYTYRKLPFDPFVDLAPLSLVCRYELGFAVGPQVPAQVQSLQDFAAWVKRADRTVAYGSPSAGSALHFMAHAYSTSRKLGMVHVPYRGAAPMVADVLGGQVAAAAASLPALMAHAGSGGLRVLACTGASRSRLFPQVPTFEEQGVPGLRMREWQGIYVAGKPEPQVLARVAALISTAAQTPAFSDAMLAQGFEAATSTPGELDRLARADAERWRGIVAASGFVQTS